MQFTHGQNIDARHPDAASACFDIVPEEDAGSGISPEDQARADFYALIARLLWSAPDPALLRDLAGADSLDSEMTDNPLELAWEKLVLVAGVMDPEAVREEFDSLFVSIGTPRINPYASRYLTGFDNEKPRAEWRGELARLGLTRAPGVGEFEDHLAALCETMRLLIAGAPKAARQPVSRQRRFFDAHIAPWYERCLDDIRAAGSVNFYRQVADFTQAFLATEAQAFEMDELQEASREAARDGM